MKLPVATLLLSVRLLCILLALCAIPAGEVSFVGAAHAQEQRQGVGLLRFLFQRREPPRQERVAPPTRQRRAAEPAKRRSTPAAPPPEPVIEKAENAKRVLVVGDFVASGLASGLEAAFAQNPDVAVVDKTNGSSGLVRSDHYDWPGNIASVIDATTPAAVVVMIGANDRQQMVVGGTRVEPRTDEWTAEYERRVTALAKAVRDKGLPLLWVGNLPYKSPSMTSDMVVFNDIYRRIVTDAGGEYIDVWDGFVDEAGNFAAAGPDINGQPAQLRSSDGINVTRQGRRKIAYYLEKPLGRLFGLGGAVPEPGVLQPEGVLPPAVEDGTPAVIDRTPPMPIEDLSAEGSELLGASFKPGIDEVKTDADRLRLEGIGPAPRKGRADDFSLPDAAATSKETTSALPQAR